MATLDLFIKITALNAASRVIGGVSDGLNGLARSAGATGAVMTGVITAPIVAGFLSAAGAVATYEQNLNVLAQTAGLTAAQQAEAGRVAKQLGADVTIPGANAGDAAAAMLELGKAGLGFTDIIGAAPGVLRLAAAGELAVADAARIAANALNAFNLPGSQATRVADVLAAAANASSADVSGMALAFQQGSAAAAAANVPIEQFAATLGLMANRGIQASDAGTSFKTFMASLAKDTKPAIQAQKLLGISFFDAAGKMKALPIIAEDLRRKLKPLSDLQRSQVINKIFGSDAGRLAQVFGSLDEGEFNDMIAAVGKTGAAADLAGARMKGLAGAVEILKNAWDTLVITTLEPFLPVMTAAVGVVTNLLTEFDALGPNVKNAALAFAAVLASAGPFLLLVSGLAAGLAFLLTPFGVITAGLAVMAGRWALNGGRLEDFLPKLEAFGIILRNVMQGKDSVRLLELAFQNLTGIDVSGWFQAAADAFVFVRDAALTFIGALNGTWATDATGKITPLHQAIGNVGLFISNVALPALTALGQWFISEGLPRLQEFGAFIVGTVLPALAQFGAFISTNVLPAVQAFGSWFVTNALPALQQFAAFVVGTVIPAVAAFAVWFGGAALTAAQAFGDWFRADGIPLLGSFMGLISAIGGIIVAIVGPAFLVLSQNAGAILREMGPLADAIAGLLTTLGPVAALFGILFGAIAAAIPGLLRQLTGFITGLTGTVELVIALIGGLSNAMAALNRGDAAGALAALQKTWTDIGTAMTKVAAGGAAVQAGQQQIAAGQAGFAAGLMPPLPGAPGGVTERPPVPFGPPAPTAEELERQAREREAREAAIAAHARLAASAERTADILDGIPTDWGSRFAAAMEAR